MRAAARVTGAAMSCRSRCQPVGPVTSTTCRSPVAPSWSRVSLEAASWVETSATVGIPGKSCTRRRTSWTALGGQRCTERRMPSTGRSRTARTASGTLSRCRSVKQPVAGGLHLQALGGEEHGGDGRPIGRGGRG